MMTKQQHIDYWVRTAEEDWLSVEVLLKSKRYVHCLFFAHLVLEKLAKAHWVKNNQENIPPKIHNIVWLLEKANVDLGEEIMIFWGKFNRFQLSTRYPDYINQIYNYCTKDYTINQLDKVKEIRQCLLKMLQ